MIPIHYLTNWTFKIAVVLAMVLGIIGLSYFFIDIPLAVFCQALDQRVKDVFQVINLFGISSWYLVISLILFLFWRFFRRNKTYAGLAMFIFLSIAVSGILTNIIKFAMGRWRPKMFFEQGFYGFDPFQFEHDLTSFPSGHVTTIFALATALAVYYKKMRWPLFSLALVVSASRLVLGSHYFSDTIGGALVGYGTVQWLYRKYFRFLKKEGPPLAEDL